MNGRISEFMEQVKYIKENSKEFYAKNYELLRELLLKLILKITSLFFI